MLVQHTPVDQYHWPTHTICTATTIPTISSVSLSQPIVTETGTHVLSMHKKGRDSKLGMNTMFWVAMTETNFCWCSTIPRIAQLYRFGASKSILTQTSLLHLLWPTLLLGTVPSVRLIYACTKFWAFAHAKMLSTLKSNRFCLIFILETFLKNCASLHCCRCQKHHHTLLYVEVKACLRRFITRGKIFLNMEWSWNWLCWWCTPSQRIVWWLWKPAMEFTQDMWLVALLIPCD